MSTVTEESTPTSIRRDALEQRVILMAPGFGWWKGNYQLPKAQTTVEVDGTKIDAKDVTTPRSKLMSDDYPVAPDGTPWKKRFSKLNSRQKGLVEQFSVPFPIRNPSFASCSSLLLQSSLVSLSAMFLLGIFPIALCSVIGRMFDVCLFPSSFHTTFPIPFLCSLCSLCTLYYFIFPM